MASYYDIYGFVIKIDGTAESSFQREYWRFESCLGEILPIDLEITQVEKVEEQCKMSPTASLKGLWIDFKAKKVYYEKGLSGDFVLYYTEPLIQWPDKILLHAGAVEKDGKAYLFPASGGVGKTAMVTELSKRGYKYLADDWVIVGTDGMAYPLLKTIHMFDYNLSDITIAKKILGWKRIPYKLFFTCVNFCLHHIKNRTVRFILGKLQKTFNVDILKLFAEVGKPAKIDKVFWLIKDKELVVVNTNSSKLSALMPYVINYEHNHFLKEYQRYAYYYGQVDYIENRNQKIRDILRSATENAEVYGVYVPDKINPQAVVEKLINLGALPKGE